MRVARLTGSIPPSAREILNSERLPQTRHSSCGLSLTLSQSAHNTALLREMAFNWRTLSAPMSTTNLSLLTPNTWNLFYWVATQEEIGWVQRSLKELRERAEAQVSLHAVLT
jgi:hypothetical protein